MWKRSKLRKQRKKSILFWCLIHSCGPQTYKRFNKIKSVKQKLREAFNWADCSAFLSEEIKDTLKPMLPTTQTGVTTLTNAVWAVWCLTQSRPENFASPSDGFETFPKNFNPPTIMAIEEVFEYLFYQCTFSVGHFLDKVIEMKFVSIVPSFYCSVPELSLVLPKHSLVSRFSAKSPDSRTNFAFLPKQALSELSITLRDSYLIAEFIGNIRQRPFIVQETNYSF